MPFDDLLTHVAVPPVPRHDAGTCCPERQVPDVGGGWRWLGADEMIDPCDEVLMDGIWQESFACGQMVGQRHERYRRRVTPVPPAEADTAAQWRALRKGEEIRDGDEGYYALVGWKPSHLKIGTVVGDGTMQFRRRVTPDRSSVQPEHPLGAYLDEENNELREQVATLTAEVERLRLTNEERNTLERISFLLTHHNIARDAETIARIGTRLGGGE